MNSLLIAAIAIACFLWSYRVYARKLEKLFDVDPKAPTPAVTKRDNVDYVPARHWLVLFGHHFSSIAGAGPIIGPVIACLIWGWLPALIWIVLGTIFIGGTHDFASLICSVKEGGSSIADIAQRTISRRAKILFSLFVWCALILVNAVFAYLCADTFVKEPRIVLPSLGLIPVAILFGYLFHHRQFSHFLSTVIGLVLLVGLIFLGNKLPVRLPYAGFVIWITVLFVYSFFASVTPVHMLLQPRDYLSSFLLFGGVGFGYIGLLITRPALQQAAYTGWRAPEGGIWPIMFVTIACGAISGFHSIIASGTTSKQLASEKDARKIGYGAMVMEGLVAVIAVLAVAAGISGGNFAALLKETGPINSFAQGYAAITRPLLGHYGGFIAVTILNAFILTTLDTSTRISRYLTEELFGVKSRYAATFVIVALSAALALSGAWQKIWPVFGASNQLVAALALLVVSCWLLVRKKPVMITLVPAAFMFVTTVIALAMQAKKYSIERDYFLLGVSVVLLALALFLLYETIRIFLKPRTA